MHLRIAILGIEVLSLSVDQQDEPPHIEDHTGYPMGFAPSAQQPSFVDLPDRDL